MFLCVITSNNMAFAGKWQLPPTDTYLKGIFSTKNLISPSQGFSHIRSVWKSYAVLSELCSRANTKKQTKMKPMMVIEKDWMCWQFSQMQVLWRHVWTWTYGPFLPHLEEHGDLVTWRGSRGGSSMFLCGLKAQTQSLHIPKWKLNHCKQLEGRFAFKVSSLQIMSQPLFQLKKMTGTCKVRVRTGRHQEHVTGELTTVM